ncbi:MAG: hypothetical protein AB9856_14185 [Cellulosilyticaceae bacterium]
MDKKLVIEHGQEYEIEQEVCDIEIDGKEKLHISEGTDVENIMKSNDIEKTIEDHRANYIDIDEEDSDYEKVDHGIAQDIEVFSDKVNEKTTDDIKDTSFETYIQSERIKEKTQNKKIMDKIKSMLKRFCTAIFRIPVNIVVMGSLLGLAGMVFIGVITSLGAGIFVLGATAFIGTASLSLIGVLGIFTMIALFSIGGLLILLLILIVKMIKHRIVAKRHAIKEDY